MRRFATTVLAITALLIGGLGLQPASAAGYPPCTITGTAAGETITGTEGNDVICTGGGNDTVNALGGNDIIIVSGSGIDTINGGSGNDTIDASLGTDSTIDAGSGDDTVFGTPGDDEITAGDGSDTVDGNAGDDTFTGGSGNDNLQGDIGDDTITGDTGDDTITGGDGNDTLNGTTGDDSVIGGQGVDILNGGPGSDELDGENGNDRLKGGEGDDKLLGGAGNDKLSGDSGRDKISGGEGLNVCAKDLEDENSACTYEVAFDISIAMVFSGRVLTSDGFAVPGVRVNLSNLQGSSIPGPLTDSQGRFSIPAAAGKWVVELIGYGSSEMKLPHRWTVVSSLSSAGDGLNNLLNLTQDIDADFVLPEVKKIKIQVKDSDGSPIQGAWAMDRGSCVDGQLDVRAQVYLTRSCPLGGGTYISGQSDADGNIYLYSFGYGFNVQVHFQASNGVIFEKIITIQDSALQTANLDTKPSAPIGVNTANVTTKSLILKWQIPEADGGLLITDYQVEVTSNGANSWSVIPHIASNSLGFNVTNLLPGRTYQFRVSAVTAAGVGAISNVITVTTLGAVGPNAPASLLVSGVKTNAASLSWSAVVATQKVSNYLVDVSTDGNTWVPVSKKVSTATSLALSGLRRGTAYQVRVAAVNSVGTGPYVYGSFTTLATVSTSPTVLVSSNVSGSRFTLNWNAPASNGGAAITDYLVEINGGGFSWAPINHEVTGNTSITVSGLNPGIKYTVRVKAVNRVGISKSSTSLYVTTLATTPGIVTGLKVKSVSATGAVITWTAPNAGGAKISDYKVEYSSDGGNTWLTVSKSASTSTSLTLKNLKTRKSYLFRVSAKNSVGYSAPSSNLIVAKP
jgi:hypothetical protein